MRKFSYFGNEYSIVENIDNEDERAILDAEGEAVFTYPANQMISDAFARRIVQALDIASKQGEAFGRIAMQESIRKAIGL